MFIYYRRYLHSFTEIIGKLASVSLAGYRGRHIDYYSVKVAPLIDTVIGKATKKKQNQSHRQLNVKKHFAS